MTQAEAYLIDFSQCILWVHHSVGQGFLSWDSSDGWSSCCTVFMNIVRLQAVRCCICMAGDSTFHGICFQWICTQKSIWHKCSSTGFLSVHSLLSTGFLSCIADYQTCFCAFLLSIVLLRICKVSRMKFLCIPYILRIFAWIILQNLFLYGYGALFNFLAILCTAIYKGIGASLLFSISWFLCALWGLSPHLGHCYLKVSCANMALLSNNPTLDLSFNVLISCYAISEYDWVMQGQEQEEMVSILWKGTQRPPCAWSSIMQLRVSFPHFSSNMQVSLLCLTTSACHSLFLMGISNPHCMHQILSFFKGLHLAQFWFLPRLVEESHHRSWFHFIQLSRE